MRPRTKLLAGVLAGLVLLPVAVSAAVRVYVGSFMRFSKRQVVDRRLPLSNGGVVDVRGVEILDNIPDRPRVLAWSAAYRPAGGAGTEPVGDWEATKDGTAAYAWRDLVVVIPTTDYYERGIQRVFVRTTTGSWREIRLDFRELSDGIDPPILCSYKTAIDPGDLGRIRDALGPLSGGLGPRAMIERFHPDRGELSVSLGAGQKDVTVRLGLSDDGERLSVLATKASGS